MLQSHKYAEKIKRDQQDGVDLGVTATPTFFVGDHQLRGVPSYDDLRSEVEAALPD